VKERTAGAILAVLLVLLAWMQFYGLDRLVLSSDELFRARALVGEDWDLFKVAWPAEAVREHFQSWPVHMPPGLGLLMRAAVVVLGPTPLALRLFPWLFGVAGVLMIYWMYRSIMGRRFALLPLVMAGFASSLMLTIAKTMKHYTADVFFCALIYWIAWRIVREGKTRDWVWLGVVSAAAFWISFGSVFVAAAVYLTLAVYVLARRAAWSEKKKVLIHYAGASLAAAASLGVLFFLIIQPAFGNDAFIDHISKSGLQLFDWSRWNQGEYWARYLARMVHHTFRIPMLFFRRDLAFGALINALIAYWAVLSLRRRNWLLLSFFFTPYLLIILGSFAGKYPLKAYELVTFTMPAWLVMATAGLRELYDRLAVRRRLVANACIAGVVLFTAYLSYLNLHDVRRLHFAGGRRVDKAIALLMDNAQDRDTAFIHWGAILPFYVYGTDHAAGYQSEYPIKNRTGGRLQVIWGEEHLGNLAGNEEQFQRIESVPGRLWLVFCHKWPSQEMEVLIQRIEAQRPLIQRHDLRKCQVLLFGPRP